MNKIGLIISREYKSRVAKKSFIILTLLMPLLMIAIMIVPIWMSNLESKDLKHLTVIDQTGLYTQIFKDTETYSFDIVEPKDVVTKQGTPELTKYKTQEDIDAIVVINKDLSLHDDGVTIYSKTQVPMTIKDYVDNILDPYVTEQKLAKYQNPDIENIIKDSKTRLDIKTVKFGEGEEKSQNSSTEIAMIIGIATTMIIYLFIFISGSMVMNSVMQEKKSRIVEVMIGSVKPFQLMMGKIISMALVAFTQLAVWGIVMVILLQVVSAVTGLNLSQATGSTEDINQMMAAAPGGLDMSGENVQEIIQGIISINWMRIFTSFILYFIGGYFLYASLFAAIGSAIDDDADANQFVMPITLIILFAFYAGIYSMKNPDGPLAFWCSIIPFTSPIVMMVRLPFDVPFWQLLLSLSLLFLTVWGAIWVSAKIYRTGILLYGKKITWKELFKWLSYKD